jgi:hypothetical protein
VVSARADDRAWKTGEILSEWMITADELRVETDVLHVRKVQQLIEPHQEMVLLFFSNSSLQYAFMSSDRTPGTVLVVTYLGGKERMRCAITRDLLGREGAGL